MTLEVKLVHPGWLESHEGVWAEVLGDSDAHPIFMSWSWVISWWETFGADRTPCFLTCWDGTRLVALAFLCTGASTSVLTRDRLEIVGQGSCGADYLDFVARRTYRQAAADALAAWLAARKHSNWSWAEFDGVQPHSLAAQVAKCLAAHMRVGSRAATVCPVLRLEGSFRELLGHRFARKQRYNLERQARLASTRHGLTARFDTRAATALDNLHTVFRLHARRKRAQQTASSFRGSDIVAFHERLVLRLAERGNVSFGLLEHRGSAVAAAYCLVAERRLCYFQTGFEPELAPIGVGSVLLFESLRNAFDQGFVEFDFLRGAESYKFVWTDETRRLERFRLFRPSARGFAFWSADRAADLARRAIGEVAMQAAGKGTGAPVTADQRFSASRASVLQAPSIAPASSGRGSAARSQEETRASMARRAA